MPPLLSAVVIVHNEEAHLGACLASVREIADEIIVLDDGSTDATVSIAKLHGARVAVRKLGASRRFSMAHALRIPWELFSRLVLRMGILDGRAGVIHATMASFYAFVQYAKLWRKSE